MLSNFMSECSKKIANKAISPIINIGFKRSKFDRKEALDLIRIDKKVMDTKPWIRSLFLF